MGSQKVTYRSNQVFDALADPTRRSILELLSQGSQPAGRIAEAFPMSRPAVSKHLRLLRHARLVHERRNGRHRVYELDAEPLKMVDTWLHRYRIFWNASLLGLKQYLENEGTVAQLSPREARGNRGPRGRLK